MPVHWIINGESWTGIGQNGAVPVGTIEAFGKTSMKTSEGHSFVISDPESGLKLTRTARAGSGTYFVLTPSDSDESASIRVKCTLKPSRSEVPASSNPQEVNIDVFPEWSPRGASRFLELVREKFFDGGALTRVVPRFLTQVLPLHAFICFVGYCVCICSAFFTSFPLITLRSSGSGVTRPRLRSGDGRRFKTTSQTRKPLALSRDS